jgi:hypothetical protein
MARQDSTLSKSPLIQDVQAARPPAQPVHTRRMPSFLRRWPKLSHKKGLAAVVVALVLVGGLFVLALSRAPVAPIPAHFGKDLGVKLYHPTQLPKDVVFAPGKTFVEKDGVVTEFTDKSGKGSLFLTQQKRPKGTDLKQIDAPETYLAPAGAVYFLNGEKGRLQAIIEADESWILVDSPTSFGIDRVKDVISHLQAQPQG